MVNLIIDQSSILLVNPAESWLKDELDGTVYFPMYNGHFDLREQRISPYATQVQILWTTPTTSSTQNLSL